MREPVQTFTMGFDDPGHDERPYARAVAERIGTTHREELVEPEALAILPELVEHYGEPFADSSALATYYVSRLAARHVKMVLSGDGGDENFAGYPTYPWALQTIAKRGPSGPYRRVRHAVANAARAVGLWPEVPWSTDDTQIWRGIVAYFPDAERTKLWRPAFRDLVEASRAWFDAAYASVRAPDVCSRLQKLDIEMYLPFDILTKVDIASMCHGLEVRVPLLDHRLMELVATMPSRLKLRVLNRRQPAEEGGSEGKHILKRLGERYLGNGTLRRRKQGFSVPLGEWFRGPLRCELSERLGPKDSAVSAYLDPEYVTRLIEANDEDGRQGFRIWALLFLNEWLDRNRSRLS
jgi:asparagine synthase (glutamine-hydrolysing)